MPEDPDGLVVAEATNNGGAGNRQKGVISKFQMKKKGRSELRSRGAGSPGRVA